MIRSDSAGRHRSAQEDMEDATIPDAMVARRFDAPCFDEAKRSAVSQVLLIDPRSLTRASLSSFLEAMTQNFRISAISTPALVADSPASHRGFDLVIYSIGATSLIAPSVLQDIELLDRHLADIPFVILSDREERNYVIEALRHGARGYIPSTLSPEIVIAALRLVQAGGIFIPASALLASISYPDQKAVTCNGTLENVESRCSELTRRESDVLELLGYGKSNKVIAYELSMCESTVKAHVRRIMQKLQATNRTQVALLAQRLHGHSEPTDDAEEAVESD